ncbi:hypothetical protein FQA47_007522 [Oryzias melastigma]|uniref:Uncharacterized protein n=1 Tax=Oryzias melastigma TaxID=30732 RepID=A0A834F0M8_ORYME|nr:hypothetical protein FQA47_007522 [Oryzias melastigma]
MPSHQQKLTHKFPPTFINLEIRVHDQNKNSRKSKKNTNIFPARLSPAWGLERPHRAQKSLKKNKPRMRAPVQSLRSHKSARVPAPTARTTLTSHAGPGRISIA